jgi:1-aminocyclopropane-1-carboxylate deaminase/D-cysteine desulfhydrase-like pyridoxal-dependent ACC family enzyme
MGADTLVSIGGVQSNHTRQVTATAAHLGLRCVLVQESWVDWPDAVYDRVGNIQLSRIMGADVRLVEAGFGFASCAMTRSSSTSATTPASAGSLLSGRSKPSGSPAASRG